MKLSKPLANPNVLLLNPPVHSSRQSRTTKKTMTSILRLRLALPAIPARSFHAAPRLLREKAPPGTQSISKPTTDNTKSPVGKLKDKMGMLGVDAEHKTADILEETGEYLSQAKDSILGKATKTNTTRSTDKGGKGVIDEVVENAGAYAKQAAGAADEYLIKGTGAAAKYAGKGKGVADEYLGKTKGVADELVGKGKGVAHELAGKAKGTAEEYLGNGKLKGKADEYLSKGKKKAEEYIDKGTGAAETYLGKAEETVETYADKVKGRAEEATRYADGSIKGEGMEDLYGNRVKGTVDSYDSTSSARAEGDKT